MGKSTAADILAQLGVPSIDTDVIAREVVAPGQPALEAVRASFGDDVINPDGSLNRSEMARRVFHDPHVRKRLEAILHPRIREVWLARANNWRRENRPAGIVVIPLLFETDASGEFDATVCVACSAATQKARLLTRGWTEEHVTQRIQSQLAIAVKMERSTYVTWSEGTLDVLRAQLAQVLRNLGLEAPRQ
jgi:dephospho-CoA kinase